MNLRRVFPVFAATLVVSAVHAQMAQHKPKATCDDISLACAGSASPVFGPSGSLWIAARVNNKIFVTRSNDLGKTFSAGVVITVEGANLDWGPDARPKIVVDRDGRVIVCFATFRDQNFNGAVFCTRSIDGGRTFSTPEPITADAESQRFVAMAIDSDGSVFSAWLDKRSRAAAGRKGEAYKGAGLAFAWSNDQGATFAPARIGQENTCECCRIDIGFAAPERPVILFRNIFDGSIRDHAILTFTDRNVAGPIFRVSNDNWATEACPHHGPSLAISADGAFHAAWYTGGQTRKGLFYARSFDKGQHFSDPIPIGRPDQAPSRPNLVAAGGKVWLAWKEFDGETSRVMTMVSRDNGAHWSEPKALATTTEDSDHPIVVSDGARTFLSWQTRQEGYRIIGLDDKL